MIDIPEIPKRPKIPLRVIRRYLINEAVRELGVTSILKYGVSMLPDGRLVDGRWDKQHDRIRTVDHSDFPLTEKGVDYLYSGIRQYGCFGSPPGTSTPDWYYFISGCIRFSFFENSHGPELYLELFRPPTMAQMVRILTILTRVSPRVYLDVRCLKDCEFVIILSRELNSIAARETLLRIRKLYREYKCKL